MKPRPNFSFRPALLALLLLVMGAMGLAGCGEPTSESGQESSLEDIPQNQNSNTIKLNVDLPEGEKLEYALLNIGPISLAELMKTAIPKYASESDSIFVFEEYPGMGSLVKCIKGLCNSDQERYWQFCVNGVVAPKGINDTELENGDQVDWYFVRYNESPCKKIGE